METKPFKLVAVALANKLARIAFAVMRDQTPFSAKHSALLRHKAIGCG